MIKDQKFIELIKWLEGEKYLINHNPNTMTENFEKRHTWGVK